MWLHENKTFDPDYEAIDKKYYGFVYLIENLENGKKYVGKKLFHHKKILPANKTRKRRKRVLIESDWRNYYGSSESLHSDLELYGKQAFRRTILHFCRSKGECSYLEAKEQFERKVLEDNSYYNSWISVKVHRKHLG